MTNRKKKGIGLIISGVVSVIMGAVMFFVIATPAWASIGVTVIGAVMSTLNIYFIAPDTKEKIKKVE